MHSRSNSSERPSGSGQGGGGVGSGRNQVENNSLRGRGRGRSGVATRRKQTRSVPVSESQDGREHSGIEIVQGGNRSTSATETRERPTFVSPVIGNLLTLKL